MMRSLLSDKKIEIRFKNHMYTAVDVWWVNFNGQEQWWFELSPGESRGQPTYATHPWVVRLKDSCEVLRRVDPGASCCVDIGDPQGGHDPLGASPSSPSD